MFGAALVYSPCGLFLYRVLGGLYVALGGLVTLTPLEGGLL